MKTFVLLMVLNWPIYLGTYSEEQCKALKFALLIQFAIADENKIHCIPTGLITGKE